MALLNGGFLWRSPQAFDATHAAVHVSDILSRRTSGTLEVSKPAISLKNRIEKRRSSRRY